jgi:ketosteroid isomerase-like protein
MSAMDVGKALVALCQQGKFQEAISTYYHADVVSVEAGAPPGAPPEAATTVGLAGVQAKGDWWQENHIVHGATVEGPWPHGDRFMARFIMDVTFKPSGQRMTMDEMALYTVTDGKITREEFFYSMG